MAVAAMGGSMGCGVPITKTADPIGVLDAKAAHHVTRYGSAWVTWRSWGHGRPLVLLHGDAGSWTHWSRNIEDLARHRQVIVPDLPGYGDSDLPPDGWTPETLARMLADGIAIIIPSATTYDVAGYSFGGVIAAVLAGIDAARIGRLAVLGPGGLGLPTQHRGRPLRRMEPDMNTAARLAVHRHNLAALMFADPSCIDDPTVRAQAANIARSRLRVGNLPDSDWLLRGLARTTMPLLAIWGEHDAFAAPLIAEREAALRRVRPDVDFRVIEGVGHFVQYEAADAVNAMLVAWFSGSASR